MQAIQSALIAQATEATRRVKAGPAPIRRLKASDEERIGAAIHKSLAAQELVAWQIAARSTVSALLAALPGIDDTNPEHRDLLDLEQSLARPEAGPAGYLASICGVDLSDVQ